MTDTKTDINAEMTEAQKEEVTASLANMSNALSQTSEMLARLHGFEDPEFAAACSLITIAEATKARIVQAGGPRAIAIQSYATRAEQVTPAHVARVSAASAADVPKTNAGGGEA